MTFSFLKETSSFQTGFPKIENQLVCVGWRYHSDAVSVEEDMAKIFRKISRKCNKYVGVKSVFVNKMKNKRMDYVTFSKFPKVTTAGAGRRLSAKVMKNPGGALRKGARFCIAAVSGMPRATSSFVPGITMFCDTGDRFSIKKFV